MSTFKAFSTAASVLTSTDISAIKEVFDRVDGKATQTLDTEGVGPVTVVIRKFDFDTDDHGTETDAV